MLQQSLAVALFLSTALATPRPIQPDPAGDHLLNNGAGLQFVTGACANIADCSQAVVQTCCAFIGGGGAETGICSGIAVANANGKAGCGFGDPPSEPVAQGPPAGGSDVTMEAPLEVEPVTDPPAQDSGSGSGAAAGSAACTVDAALAGSQNVGLGAQTQFITGQCFSAADCASGCCVAQASGVSLCKATLVTQEAGGSCDFSCGL